MRTRGTANSTVPVRVSQSRVRQRQPSAADGYTFAIAPITAISKHIKVLERAGLVVRGRRAQYRPCALDAAPLKEVATWTERYRPVWEERFDRMDEYLTRLQAQREKDEHHD